MSKVSYAQHKVGQFIMSKTGISFLELPDSATISDWVEMTYNHLYNINSINK